MCVCHQVWATGFYEELDFMNEAANQERMKQALEVCVSGCVCVVVRVCVYVGSVMCAHV